MYLLKAEVTFTDVERITGLHLLVDIYFDNANNTLNGRMVNIKNFARDLSDRTILVLLLIVFGIVLTLTIIRGVFIIDEDNYLVTVVGLQHGMLKMPGTENLTPSNELVYFDPEASRRSVQSTPVVSLAPPIYAFLALPFSYAGWRGLVLLNILSFLVAIYLVFRYVDLITHQRVTSWIACILFAIGGYCIEYAQGMWPEMLSVVLCMGTLILCLKGRQSGSIYTALAAGILVGIAVGVREQNIFFAGCAGLGLVLYGTKRMETSIAYAAGVVLMLAVIATLNLYRVGIWHPFPKVGGYASIVAANTVSTSVFEPLRVFWSKVVDYSSYGPDTDHIRSGFYQWDAESGTALLNGIVKKSWIQSSPWIGLALIAMVVSWFSPRKNSKIEAKEIRVLGLIVVPTVLMFVAAGFNRTDGLSFNQRYFLELVPLCAIALSLFIRQEQIGFLPMGMGTAIGIIAVVGILILPTQMMKHFGQRYMPMLLALGLLLVWYLWGNRRAFSIVLGACIGWAFFIHVESDLVGSRFRREINASRYEYLNKTIPNHSALFTFWGNKDAAGPIQLDKDVVILDVWADEGRDAKTLEEELLTRGRRIFILENDMPEKTLRSLVIDRRFREYSTGNLKLIEVFDGQIHDLAR